MTKRADPVGLSSAQACPRVVLRHNGSDYPTSLEWPACWLRSLLVPRITRPTVAIAEGAHTADVTTGNLSWLWVVDVGIEVVADIVHCAARVGATVRASGRSRQVGTCDLPNASLDRRTTILEAGCLPGCNYQCSCAVLLSTSANLPIGRNSSPWDVLSPLIGLTCSDRGGVGSGGRVVVEGCHGIIARRSRDSAHITGRGRRSRCGWSGRRSRRRRWGRSGSGRCRRRRGWWWHRG